MYFSSQYGGNIGRFVKLIRKGKINLYSIDLNKDPLTGDWVDEFAMSKGNAPIKEVAVWQARELVIDHAAALAKFNRYFGRKARHIKSSRLPV